MNNILNLVTSKFINIEKLVFFSQDEIIFDVTDWPEAKLQYIQLKEYLKNKYIELYTDEQMQNKKISLKVEYFKLHKINGIKGYYKKVFNDDESISYKFKCVEPNMYPLILRKFNNEKIQENDKVFFADQTLAKYINIPEFNI